MDTSFGIFLSPLHDPKTDPHVNIHRDLELVEFADRLGFDECWFGEHHSLGWPLIGAPETMIAAAAVRTSRIVLANGVVTVPFHHPFHIATRALLLDHLTRGRYILGLGPGATPNDAYMLGVPAEELKPRTKAALPTIIELVNGDRRLTEHTDWYDLVDARMQLPPYTKGGIGFAVSSVGSPFGPQVAAEFGLSLLSFGAPPPGWPGADLAGQWRIAEESAAAHGTTVDRADWRIAVPIHIAETRKRPTPPRNTASAGGCTTTGARPSAHPSPRGRRRARTSAPPSPRSGRSSGRSRTRWPRSPNSRTAPADSAPSWRTR